MVVAIAATPKCSACDLDRQATQTVPVNEDYVIVSYECPNCKTTIRLVEWQDRVSGSAA